MLGRAPDRSPSPPLAQARTTSCATSPRSSSPRRATSSGKRPEILHTIHSIGCCLIIVIFLALRFEFFPANHTVSQSAFETPCDALTNEDGVTTGIATKYNFATDAADGKHQPIFLFSVEDDKKPVWFYSGQDYPVNECAAGMVVSRSAVEWWVWLS